MSKYAAVSKTSIWGTHGEFSIGDIENKMKAVFLETKIRPGGEGEWVNELADQMVPWREVFDISEVTFDELLQRDLNDSRVAHELIPYLLGKTGNFARFFPPILAVLAPKATSSGIEACYPNRVENVEGIDYSFEKLFDFSIERNEDGEPAPLARIDYNRQKSAFIIVDGQHRAMAILALHRQITKSWERNKGSKYQYLYSHIEIDPAEIESIELPVCIVFFPDLTYDNEELRNKGIDLKSACREIFLIVNRKAQTVSRERELLLDDQDFAAHMMRGTLSKLKDRTQNIDTLSRIYCFAYGDSDDQDKKAVVSGQIEYSSAMALHKLHAAASFGIPHGFRLKEPADISTKPYTKHPHRPMEILFGTKLNKSPTLSRESCKAHSLKYVKEVVEYLEELNDMILLSLFDEFRPFKIHNQVLSALKTRMEDPHIMANEHQSKCYSLIFEGNGVRSVFYDHHERMRKVKKDKEDNNEEISDYIKNQIEFCSIVQQILTKREREIRRRRACKFFSIDFERFYNTEDETLEQDRVELESMARAVFDTVSTQAFQIGYLMSILTIVEECMSGTCEYESRKELTLTVNDFVLKSLNHYFSPTNKKTYQSFGGFITENRASAFNANKQGLRAFLSMFVNEINERQWAFFRYCILEIIFSEFCKESLDEFKNSVYWKENNINIENKLMTIAGEILSLRKSYIDKAVNKALNEQDFVSELDLKGAELRGSGEVDDKINSEISKMIEEKKESVEKTAKDHLKSSLAELDRLSDLSTVT